MKTKHAVLGFLEKQESYVSGQKIAGSLCITRSAVWKAIRALQDEGYQIEAVTNRGYRLVEKPDSYSEYEFVSAFCGNQIGRSYKVLDCVESTNQYAKPLAELPDNHGTVIIANQQTHGKGRMERNFYSPAETGAYFSIILRPQLHFSQIHLLTIAAAISVTSAIEDLTGLLPEIKWPNDIIVEGRKVCGILTESSVESETGRIQSVVIGIGVNVGLTRFPPDLIDQAASLAEITGKPLKRMPLIVAVLKELDRLVSAEWSQEHIQTLVRQYSDRINILGKPVTVLYPDQKITATVLGIDSLGGLVLQPDNQKDPVTITSGKVSVRRQQIEKENGHG